MTDLRLTSNRAKKCERFHLPLRHDVSGFTVGEVRSFNCFHEIISILFQAKAMALMADKEKTEMSKREVRLYGNVAMLYVSFYCTRYRIPKKHLN